MGSAGRGGFYARAGRNDLRLKIVRLPLNPTEKNERALLREQAYACCLLEDLLCFKSAGPKFQCGKWVSVSGKTMAPS